MEIFYVDCEDLSAPWSTYEKAKEYIFGEAERCKWELISVDREDDEEGKICGNCYFFKSADGSFEGTVEAYIYPMKLDEKPYILL